MGVCPKHRIALTGRCPSCRVALYADNLKARRPAELIACRKCGAKLAGAGGEPAHETALHLQQMLIMAKQSGRLTLPRIGDLEWSTMMALIDVLLGTVWIGTALKYRRQLFKRINNDLGLGDDQAERIPWRTNCRHETQGNLSPARLRRPAWIGSGTGATATPQQ